MDLKYMINAIPLIPLGFLHDILHCDYFYHGTIMLHGKEYNILIDSDNMKLYSYWHNWECDQTYQKIILIIDNHEFCITDKQGIISIKFNGQHINDSELKTPAEIINSIRNMKSARN